MKSKLLFFAIFWAVCATHAADVVSFKRLSINMSSGMAWYSGLIRETEVEYITGDNVTNVTGIGLKYEIHQRVAIVAEYVWVNSLHDKIHLKPGIIPIVPPATDIEYKTRASLIGVNVTPITTHGLSLDIGAGISTASYGRRVWPAFLEPSKVFIMDHSNSVPYYRGGVSWRVTRHWSLSSEYTRFSVGGIQISGGKSAMNLAQLKLGYQF